MIIRCCTLIALAAACAPAQPLSTSPLTPPANGPRRADSTWVALTNCTLHPRPGDTIPGATIVFRDGRITAILTPDPGPDAKPGTDDDTPPRVPLGPRTIDCTDLHAYAAFIDAYAEIEMPKTPADEAGRHWNEEVMPERTALDATREVRKFDEQLRKLGFAAACLSPRDGNIRGRSVVVSLAKPSTDPAAEKPPVYREDAYMAASLDTGGRGYPDSQMGAIALIRQTLGDAAWQRAARERGSFAGPANALDHLNAANAKVSAAPLLFDAADELELLRADKVASEFKRPAIFLASGHEYQRLEAVVSALARRAGDAPALILPLNFRKAPDVSSLGKADAVDLRDLMTWEQDPTNPRRFAALGVPFALTTARLRERNEFHASLRAAIVHGLSERDALAALTTHPAGLLGVAGELGTLESGKRANILLADGPLFARKTKLRDLYIDGQRHQIHAEPPTLEGTWDIALPGGPAAERYLTIDDDNAISVHRDKKSVKPSRVEIAPASVGTPDEPGAVRLSFVFDHEPLNPGEGGPAGVFTITALADLTRDPAVMLGTLIRPDGQRADFTAKRRPVEKQHAAIGAWRVIQADADAKDPDDPDDGLKIRIAKDELELTFLRKDKPAINIETKDLTFEAPNRLRFKHSLQPLGGSGESSDAVTIEPGPSSDDADDVLVGESTLPDGSKHTYRAIRDSDDARAERDMIARAKGVPDALGLPFGPYALDKLPEQIDAVIEGATIWTGVGEPIVDGRLAIAAGKIAFVGTADGLAKWLQQGVKLRQPWVEIKAQGKHITPGLIDAHSHTGISKGVNEGGQAITAEVRIGDVTDPDSVSWYRQLAGGVTAVLSLHGSANAIGGQSQTNKIRWGCVHPDDMHFEGAIPGIKFALGENPRQANWANDGSRYPQTRMGVETLIRDRFTAAREYAAARKKDPAGTRRDLELDPLAEILAGERLIHCHSYRQDEIVMLTQVARDFGFKIGTFQHALEAYKVADFVREYSGGASGFTDWWSFKVEVQDAIPQAFPIMWEEGVVTSFNSDSDELARRMNVEAGKAVKYGRGIAPAEALKFVTLNPAKQLRIDARVGTLEAGKDADLAIWSGPPTSSLSRCERTFVDGRELFSLEQDAIHRERIAKERERLIQKVLASESKRKGRGKGPKAGDAKPAEPPPKPPTEAELELERLALERLRRGRDADAHYSGDCGCYR